MKRRSFFKGLLGLIGIGASGFLIAKSVPRYKYTYIENKTGYVNYWREPVDLGKTLCENEFNYDRSNVRFVSEDVYNHFKDY